MRPAAPRPSPGPGCPGSRPISSLPATAAIPLDQNIYQAVKGMTAAEACVRQDGVIIMAAACGDGPGGEAFYQWFKQAAGPEEVADRIKSIPRDGTVADQWEAQILARVLLRATVILVSRHCDPAVITDMHMRHASSIDEAMAMARSIVGEEADVVIIPDGVGVVVG